MTNRRLLLQIPFALGCLFALAAPACAAEDAKSAAKPAMTLSLGGTTYLHRWSKNDQHEFTPARDPDLKKWRDMVTVNVHEAATTPEKLAEVANKMLSNYQAHGKVLKTSSRPRTVDRHAEHLVIAVFPGENYLEAAFARVMFIEGAGVIAVYSHREYGFPPGPLMTKWLETAGADAERALMAWTGIPKAPALKKLPVSP
jgi:hypothetical protein